MKTTIKYIPTITPGRYNFQGFGEIDLSNLSPARAESLVKRGFPFLKPEENKAPPKSKS